MPPKNEKWNLLVLSDLHMGEQVPGEARADVKKRVELLDQPFYTFLDHYTETRHNNLPWRLLFAGDMLDYIRTHAPVSHSQDDQDPSHWRIPPYNEQGTIEKTKQIFSLYKKSLGQLSTFVHEGNELFILTGNHDAELNWLSVQNEFREQLWSLSKDGSALSQNAFQENIQFLPWFYYEPGKIYIEHGHLYDRFCTIENFMEPSSPHTEQEELNSPVHVLCRLQNQCLDSLAKFPMERVDQMQPKDLFDWLGELNWKQKNRFFIEAFKIVWSILSIAYYRNYRRIPETSQEHQSKLNDLFEQSSFSAKSFQQIKEQLSPPVYNEFFKTMNSLYLDRLFLVTFTSLALGFLLVIPGNPLVRAAFMTLTAASFVFSYSYVAKRNPPNAAIPALLAGAVRIAPYLDARLLLFGHTHQLEVKQLRKDQFYINTGGWGIPLHALQTLEETHPFREDASEQVPTKIDKLCFFRNYLIIEDQQADEMKVHVGSWDVPERGNLIHTLDIQAGSVFEEESLQSGSLLEPVHC